jgi:hypothetical protein
MVSRNKNTSQALQGGACDRKGNRLIINITEDTAKQKLIITNRPTYHKRGGAPLHGGVRGWVRSVSS